MLNGEDSRRRLSELCRKLRGSTPLRKFVPQIGVSQATWSAWENLSANLGNDTATKLVVFIGSSFDQFRKYLAGEITLDQYLRLPKPVEHNQPEQEMSLGKVQVWIRTLPLNDLASIAVACLEIIKESANTNSALPLNDLASIAVACLEIIKESANTDSANLELYELLSSQDRPSNSEIVKMAGKLGIETEELMKLCDRLFPKEGRCKNECD